jgi:hypothetical protein
MARRQAAGQLRVSFLTAIANTGAPTVAELNAGVDITKTIARDGLNSPTGGQSMDVADVSSRFNKKASGTYGGDDLTLKGFRDSSNSADLLWTTFPPVSASLPGGTVGYIVARRFGGSTTAWTTGDKVETYPVEVTSRENEPIAENKPYAVTVMLAVTDEPVMTAVVA